jgi:hypothetical protein
MKLAGSNSGHFCLVISPGSTYNPDSPMRMSGMKKHSYVTVDHASNAAYIYLAGPIPPGGVADTVEGAPGINLDFDREGRLLGIELLSLKYLHPNLLQAAADEA